MYGRGVRGRGGKVAFVLDLEVRGGESVGLLRANVTVGRCEFTVEDRRGLTSVIIEIIYTHSKAKDELAGRAKGSRLLT